MHKSLHALGTACARVCVCMRARAHMQTSYITFSDLQSYIVHSPEANVYYTFCMDNKQS